MIYGYAVGGSSYEGSIIRFGDLSSGASKPAEDTVAKYPPGASVSVRYDPENPGRAVLETTMPGNGQVITGIALIVVPLLIVAVGALIFGPKLSSQPPVPQEQAAPAD